MNRNKEMKKNMEVVSYRKKANPKKPKINKISNNSEHIKYPVPHQTNYYDNKYKNTSKQQPTQINESQSSAEVNFKRSRLSPNSNTPKNTGESKPRGSV